MERLRLRHHRFELGCRGNWGSEIEQLLKPPLLIRKHQSSERTNRIFEMLVGKVSTFQGVLQCCYFIGIIPATTSNEIGMFFVSNPVAFSCIVERVAKRVFQVFARHCLIVHETNTSIPLTETYFLLQKL